MILSPIARVLAPATSVMAFLISTQAYAQQSTAPGQTVNAWSYTVRQQTSVAGGGITSASRYTVIQTANTKRKAFDMQTTSLDSIISRSGQTLFRPGQILITTQSKKDTVVTLLDMVRHTYRHFSNPITATSFALTGVAMSPTVWSTPVTDISSTIDSIGIGPIIQGHQTLHYRQVTHFTVLKPTKGIETIKSVYSTDYDVAPDIAIMDSVFMLSQLSSLGISLSSGVDSAVRSIAKKFPHGFPLHSETQITSVIAGPLIGSSSNTGSYSEDVDKISHGPVDAALFTIPPSYVQVLDSATHP